MFKDRQLSPVQKRSLMRFLKAAAEALEGEGPLKASPGPAAPSALPAHHVTLRFAHACSSASPLPLPPPLQSAEAACAAADALLPSRTHSVRSRWSSC